MEFEIRALGTDQERAGAVQLVASNLFSRALLHGSLAAQGLGGCTRHWGAFLGERVVGVMAQIDGYFPYRSAPIAAVLPRAASALCSAVEQPAMCLAAEPLWSELARAGAVAANDHLQMVRLRRDPIPGNGAKAKRVDDLSELEAFYGPWFGAHRLAAGPFFACHEGNELVAAGGIEFVTGRIAQISLMQTREESRSKGYGTAIVRELVAELETPERHTVLQVRAENSAAISLYHQLGFRGTRRLRSFQLG